MRAVGDSKLCPKCEGTKHVREFAANRAASDGLAWWCRGCMSAAQKRWRAAKKAAAAATVRAPESTRAFDDACRALRRNREEVLGLVQPNGLTGGAL